jgi:hypothetical protein
VAADEAQADRGRGKHTSNIDRALTWNILEIAAKNLESYINVLPTLRRAWVSPAMSLPNGSKL